MPQSRCKLRTAPPVLPPLQSDCMLFTTCVMPGFPIPLEFSQTRSINGGYLGSDTPAEWQQQFCWPQMFRQFLDYSRLSFWAASTLALKKLLRIHLPQSLCPPCNAELALAHW